MHIVRRNRDLVHGERHQVIQDDRRLVRLDLVRLALDSLHAVIESDLRRVYEVCVE